MQQQQQQYPNLSIRQLSHNKSAIVDNDERICSELKKKGWCFVELPEELKELIQEATDDVKAFFAISSERKQSFTAPYAYGYSAVDHKESFRVLTGQRLAQMERYVPEDVKASVVELSKMLDLESLNLIARLSKPLFNMRQNEVALKADLPVAYTGTQHFGMLDFAHYFNRTAVANPPAVGQDTSEVNCVPHWDPGLISLSFYSDAPGLQLKDPATDSWIDAPLSSGTIGVIWLGQAVKNVNADIPVGIHRVIYPKAQGTGTRLTAWYEACSAEQISAPAQGSTMNSTSTTLPNLPGSKAIVDHPKDSLAFLQHVERKLGLPMTKVMRPGDSFKSMGPFPTLNKKG